MRNIVVRASIPALVMLATLGVVLYLHGQPIQIRPDDIVSVRLFPLPEGPAPPPFERSPRDAGSRPLSLIADAIPKPLPHPAWQFGCSNGGMLEVQLQDGRTVAYGPCHRPQSINHLWAIMIDIVENGRCRPTCGPGGQRGP